MRSTNTNSNPGLSWAFLFIMAVVCFWPAQAMSEYTLEFWLSRNAGHFVDVPGWLALLIGLATNGVMFLAWLLTLLFQVYGA